MPCLESNKQILPLFNGMGMLPLSSTGAGLGLWLCGMADPGLRPWFSKILEHVTNFLNMWVVPLKSVEWLACCVSHMLKYFTDLGLELISQSHAFLARWIVSCSEHGGGSTLQALWVDAECCIDWLWLLSRREREWISVLGELLHSCVLQCLKSSC